MFDNFKPKHLLILLISLTFVSILGLILSVKIITSEGMPSLSQLENPEQNIATQIFSADGEILDHFFIERRVLLTYNEIPPDFVNALVATEDKKFWKHWGVHLKRVFNSFVKNIFSSHREGASTITMQLTGNLYLNRRETSMVRKIREAVTAFQVEQTYTKQEIIELYANTVNFGRGSYGLQVAANKYFDKEPINLTTAECAFLVGLLKKPEFYNKRDNYDAAIQRRNLVLSMMLDENYITNSQYNKAVKEAISFMQTVVPKNQEVTYRRLQNMGIAPHFVETIRQNIKNDKRLQNYDFYKDGLTIYTTINAQIQRAVNNAVNLYMPDLQKLFLNNFSWSRNKSVLDKLLAKAIKENPAYKKAKGETQKERIYASLATSKSFVDSVKNVATTIQLGVVVIDPTTGAIVAMVGASPKFMAENPDAKYSLNHAVQIYRQPGSAFKPFVYASALMKGNTPASTIESGPYSYTLPTGEVWSPRGSSKDENGIVTYTGGLIGSINSVAARLITQVTNPAEVVALAQKAGIDSKLDAVPALALGGGGDISPIELTAAYEIFANNGIFMQPYYYDKIENIQGEIVAEHKLNNSINDVFEAEISSQMTYMLRQVINSGTATRVKNHLKDVESAGKTGTTNDAADAWFVGYTPQLVCGIWAGFADKRINFNCLGATGYGGRVAAPLWGAIMAEIYKIPRLPYKQKHFSKLPAADSLAVDTNQIQQILPYRLTKEQLRLQQEQMQMQLNNNIEESEGTFLP